MDNQYSYNTNVTTNKDEEITSFPVSPFSQSLNSSILSLVIIAVFELETPITEFEILEICHKHVIPLNVRFSSIMERNKKGVVRWKKVVTRVEDHLIVPTFPSSLVSRESYDEYLREYLSKISCEKFSEDKPLWEFHLVKYPSLNGACTLILKVSHAIGDGYSLVSLFFKSLFQRADRPLLPLSFPQISLKKQDDGKHTSKGMGRKMLGFMSMCGNTTYDLIEATLRATCLEDQPSAIRSDASKTKIDLFRPFKIYSMTLSLERVNQVKTKLCATVNDVITGLLSYIIHLYVSRKMKMDQYGEDGSVRDSKYGGANTTNMTLSVMLNMRVFEGFTNIEDMIRADAWGNRSRSMCAKLPGFTEKLNPLDFILRAKKTMDRKKNSMMFYFIDRVLNAAIWFRGQKGLDEMIYSTFKNTSTMISSVIGPKEKMALCNHPVNSFYYFISGVPQSITFTSVSCMEELKLVVTMEKGFIDSELFTSCMDEAFEDIYQAAFENSKDNQD